MKEENRILTLLNEISTLLKNDKRAPCGKTLNSIERELVKIKDILNQNQPDTKPPSDQIRIWSDGACKGNPGPGGWASIIQIDGIRKEISGSLPHTTNNIMELTAALEAMRLTPKGSRIILTTDSQYLINGISDWIVNWKKNNWKKKDGKPVLNRELWQELDAESRLRHIEWKWIKGHSGHPENERCDQLANNAITDFLD